MARARSFLDERREALAASDAPVNGIEALEVSPADQTELSVTFVRPLPGEPGGVPDAPALSAADIDIEGGDRVRGIATLSVSASGRVLTVRVSEPGDFSTYTLRVADHVAGFDPILRTIDFSFKVNCPTDIDCDDPPRYALDAPKEPRIDHLARDYESFRRTILDRMAVLAPDWADRNPADIGVTLVELLAYLGDGLSYKLDMVDTESSLATARLRTSAARHARLVGYEMHHGVSARVLAQVRLAEGVAAVDLPGEDMAFATRTPALSGPVVPPREAGRALAAGAQIFEPALPEGAAARLVAANERLRFHDWGDGGAVLRAGATEAWMRDPGAASDLRAGQILVLVQRRDPATGREADADPAMRQAVRLAADPETLGDPLEPTAEDGQPLRILRVRWAAEDALRFDLPIGRAAEDPQPAEMLGNIVVADHGHTLPAPEALGDAPDMTDPELPPSPGEPDEPKALDALTRPRRFRPRLARPDLTFAAPEFDEAGQPGAAAALTRLDPAAARPAIFLRSSGDPSMPPAETETWRPERSLLGAGPEERVFVAEIEADGAARLRFGDGVRGRRPDAGHAFEALYRVGGGPAGAIGADALAHVLTDRTEIAGVGNPLPASGGARRETIAETRQRAPTSFRGLKRAVTLEDYETLLTGRDDVQRAQARKRWIGSWSAISLTVDRAGGAEVNDVFRDELIEWLEPYRMMGHDLAIDPPIFVPLELELKLCVDPGHFAETVREAVEEEFAPGVTRDGRRGFFHPAEITFGEDVFLSRIYERALAVDGVADVSVSRFRRAGSAAVSGLDTGVLRFERREIPILSNDPNRPGEGALTIGTEGGR